jgi:hypothetical protein
MVSGLQKEETAAPEEMAGQEERAVLDSLAGREADGFLPLGSSQAEAAEVTRKAQVALGR